jgi:DnaJ-class molecular chaperone
MIQSTHYAALGLENQDRESVIRGAYRDLERRYHPRRVGPGGAQNFRAIADAYRVLSEASLRRAYDEARIREDEGTLARLPSPSPAASPRLARVVTFSLRAAPVAISSAREVMLARFARNFSGVGVPKSEAAECLHVRMFIAKPADGEGVMIRLDLPVLVRCDACAGHRAVALPQCRTCDGQGFTASERSVALFITDESSDGASLELSLAPLGIYNFYLHAAVQLGPS